MSLLTILALPKTSPPEPKFTTCFVCPCMSLRKLFAKVNWKCTSLTEKFRSALPRQKLCSAKMTCFLEGTAMSEFSLLTDAL